MTTRTHTAHVNARIFAEITSATGAWIVLGRNGGQPNDRIVVHGDRKIRACVGTLEAVRTEGAYTVGLVRNASRID